MLIPLLFGLKYVIEYLMIDIIEFCFIQSGRRLPDTNFCAKGL